ncbi:MAG: TRAP transporter substrate-binding protein DctP [Jhaorihella sp.]
MKNTTFWAPAGLVIAFAVAANAQEGEPIEWTLSYLSLNGTIYQEAAQEIPDRIKAATNGKLVITSTSSLVAGNRLLEGVRDGIVQMSMPLPAYYTGTQPLFTVPSLPGISESYDDMKALTASPYGAEVQQLFVDDYNSTELMQTAFCPQTVFSTEPMTTLEEWGGLKIRVNNRGTALIGAELGATTVSLSAGEVLPALERGVIDAVITDSCWAYGAGFDAVITHAANWKLGSVLPAPVLVNNDAWAALSPELQQILTTEFAVIEQDFEARWRERAEALPTMWRDKGVEFTEITPEQNAEVYEGRFETPVLGAWREDMARVGLDAESTLAIARDATK